MKTFALMATVFAAIQIVSCSESTETPGNNPTPKEQTSMKLWYEYPAENWMRQALPIGNGRLGAMFFGGLVREQIQFNEKTLWTGTPDTRGLYQNFGSVIVGVESHGSEVEDYRRELSISDAVGEVSYTVRGVSYKREYFASFPDDVIVARFTTPGNEGKLSMSVSLQDARPGVAAEVEGNAISIRGRMDTVSYAARVLVLNEGGTVAPRPDGNGLAVENADALTILLAAATNYDPDKDGYVGVSGELLGENLRSASDRASQKTYAELKKAHLADYRPLFNRVSLDLGGDGSGLPTNLLIGGRHNYLDALYFQYGRYLMLSSSRGIDVPNNLQGIWNDDNAPPWGSDIHTDINIQMNYWPAEVAGLSECHLPFLNFVAREALRPGGFWRRMAADLGHRGWTVAVENTIFGHSQWETNYPANAWFSMHLWEHYAYTLDEAFLRNTAWPVMESACRFWLDRLVRADDGTWEAPDEWSPETFGRQNGVPYAQQLIWDLFRNTLEAAEILGVETAFVAELREKFEALDSGLHVGDWGNLREWKYFHSSDTPANDHRHFSHLVGLFPGNQITAHSSGDFAEAARVSLDARGNLGTGWSRSWKIASWARLLDGERAYSLLKAALSLARVTEVSMSNDDGGVYENLLCAHPPFQIDGNFGAAAGIAEMLIQSHMGYVEVLPALPVAWGEGSFTGLRARGNFTVDLTWENSRPVSCTVYSGSGGPLDIRFGESAVRMRTVPGGKYEVNFAS